MIDLLVLIWSLQEGKYPLCITLLHKLIHWYFALDHYNHTRWLWVHIYDLLALPQNSTQLHNFFMDGYFTFQKTDRQFLLMELDQIHEQNNTVMKSMGGATSSLNKVDESSLARCVFCIHEFEENDMNSPYGGQLHHEDSAAFQKCFTIDINCLEKTVVSNLFMLKKLMYLKMH